MEKINEKTCPCCGAPLPEEAAFCPHCAKSINRRSKNKPPRLTPKRLVLAALILLAALLLAAGAYAFLGPKTYDGLGEVIYTDSDGTYQVLIGWGDRYEPTTETTHDAADQDRYRFPVRVYVNHQATGEDMAKEFLQKVESVEVRAESESESTFPVQCTPPESGSEAGYPGTALVCFVDYNRESPTQNQIIWTFSMKNGDTIFLRLNFTIYLTPIYNYSSENADLSSSASLQALIDQVAGETEKKDVVNIQLPAITYTEPVILRGRAFNLTGTQSGGQRTTFTAGIQIAPTDGARDLISYFDNIDFIGEGTGVGISCANRLWTTNCRFEGWKTALFSYGDAWVNAMDCQFENNETGLHYNTNEPSPSDYSFTGNHFKSNTTAILLERVGIDLTLDLGGCIFEDNETDIDNRCGQPLDLSGASFQ